ncbi:C39 family peptidase [Lentilactobacillus otakiensis]|uniref:GW domain-containing protein n=1 Tax=Lentilactobacillus otakiensis DSM 19908 = JCM 15040 TaxID=1423780 RepID=S4NKH9_9LACO|nr:C39 family peptidase [Lentilactobacillus otakiensis]KRL10163.1 hypothetical protein FD05_GL000282 [Lentilactobacillus otakiensis DSM 19908 = JCM 15040]MBZ3776518.1 C39 family peptidase [Lentilactobacillus otakiensis]MDV3518525.1 C39 family peptidase [Lentilactobacillus otakiensis]GAD16421.1 conserved hypothetical protein [Lentilactobacillus otakiensis DSM 19908 = JCM 15040]
MKQTIFRSLLIILGLLAVFIIGPLTANADTTYVHPTNLKVANYYTRIRSTSHDYGIYKSGGWKTSEDNLKPIAFGHEFKNKKIHVTKQETAGTGTWVKFTYRTFTGWVHLNATDQSYRWLNVPLIAQRPELPTGCEIVATTMMLNFAGSKVTKMQLAKQVPRSRNPNKGFVGSPYSPTGWYIYPKGLMRVVKRHAGSAVNMTGANVSRIKAKIATEHPVVVWVNNVDGFVNHAITITGYSSSRFYYNDPWTKKKTSMKIKTMQTHRSRDGYRALSY